MGITGIHAIPMMITYMLQGTLCDTGIPRTFYGENICSVDMKNVVKSSKHFFGYFNTLETHSVPLRSMCGILR